MSDIYKKIANPLNDSRFVGELLYSYLYNGKIYDPYNYVSESRKKYSVVFNDILFKTLFTDWKNNLNIDKINSDDYNKLISYLSSKNVKNARDFFDIFRINQLNNEELMKLISNYSPLNVDQDGYFVINSKYIDNNPDMKIEHALCINCDVAKIHQIIFRFIEKCKTKNLTYNLKFNITGTRNDSIIIYCDTNSLSKYVDILNDIIIENKLENYIRDVPLLMGKIGEKIGYFSESNVTNSSFISKREKHLSYCINQEICRWIKNNLNKNVETLSGRTLLYKQFLFNGIINKKKQHILSYMSGNIFDKRKYGYTVKDIDSLSFYNYILDYLVNNLSKIFDCIINGNKQFHLNIPYKNGYVNFCYDDFIDLLDKQKEIIFKDKQYRENLLMFIRKTSLDFGIDPDNYAVDDRVSFDLGKESINVKNGVNLDILTNFDDDSDFFIKRNDNEGIIIDSNIKRENIFKRFFKKKK